MTPLIDLKGLTICAERALVEDVEMVVYPGRVTRWLAHRGRCVAHGPLQHGRDRCGLAGTPVLLDRTKTEEGIVAGVAANARLLEATRHLRGSYFTYPPQAAARAQSWSDHWSAARDCHRTSEDSAPGHGVRHRQSCR